jgi:vacuolar protein sorting-associated protein 35
MHSTLSTLYARVTGSADLSLRLFIGCGQVADQNGFEEVAYEFFAQAFTIYEEAISDSRAQFQAVCVIASGLHTTRHFGKENYDTLITKCALHGSKLLKKPDQCRAVYLASHLWWATEIRALGEEDSKNVSIAVTVLKCTHTDPFSCIVTGSEYSNASNVRSVWPMLAWTLLYLSNFSSRY